MNVQNAKNLTIPEGDVKMIHDKDNRLLWGAVGYDTKYAGDTTQQTYSGRNLFDVVSLSNANYVLTNEIVTVVKTWTSDGRVYMNSINLVAGTYTLSYNATLSGNTKTLRFSIVNNTASTDIVNTTVGDINGSRKNYTFTLAENANIKICLMPNNSGGGTLTLTQIQLGQSSTADPYEPYTGGIPAPNPDYPQDINVVKGTQTVMVTGKNLFNKNTVVQGMLEGNGSITNVNTYVTSDYILVQPSTTYYKGTTGSARFKYYDKDKNRISDNYDDLADAAGAKAFTTPDNVYYIRFSIATAVGVDSIQLEKGSTATTYEPYQGASYDVRLTGKNLARNAYQSPVTSGAVTFTTNADGSISTSGTSNTNINFYLTGSSTRYHLDAGTYTLSIGGVETSDTTCFVYIDGSSSVWWDTRDNRITQTVPSGGVDISPRIVVRSGTNMDGITFKIQLEAGPPATSYSPYYAPIELAKIGTYQDYIYKSGDDWYVRKATNKFTVTSSLSLGKSGTSANNAYYYSAGFQDIDKTNMGSGSSSTSVTPSFSTYFGAISARDVFSSGAIGMAFDKGSGDIVDFRVGFGVNSAVNTLELFKTWLDANELKVYYPLATPTDTKITDSTLIGELEAIHEWMTRYGYQASVTGNLPMIIKQDALT